MRPTDPPITIPGELGPPIHPKREELPRRPIDNSTEHPNVFRKPDGTFETRNYESPKGST